MKKREIAKIFFDIANFSSIIYSLIDAKQSYDSCQGFSERYYCYPLQKPSIQQCCYYYVKHLIRNPKDFNCYCYVFDLKSSGGSFATFIFSSSDSLIYSDRFYNMGFSFIIFSVIFKTLLYLKRIKNWDTKLLILYLQILCQLVAANQIFKQKMVKCNSHCESIPDEAISVIEYAQQLCYLPFSGCGLNYLIRYFCCRCNQQSIKSLGKIVLYISIVLLNFTAGLLFYSFKKILGINIPISISLAYIFFQTIWIFVSNQMCVFNQVDQNIQNIEQFSNDEELNQQDNLEISQNLIENQQINNSFHLQQQDQSIYQQSQEQTQDISLQTHGSLVQEKQIDQDQQFQIEEKQSNPNGIPVQPITSQQ